MADHNDPNAINSRAADLYDIFGSLPTKVPVLGRRRPERDRTAMPLYWNAAFMYDGSASPAQVVNT